MTIRELKSALACCDDTAEIKAEEPISGEIMDSKDIMGYYVSNKTIVFYLR